MRTRCANCDQLSYRLERATEQCAKLLAVLEAVEWVPYTDKWGHMQGEECPWCLCGKPNHSPTCKRQAVIAEAKEAI